MAIAAAPLFQRVSPLPPPCPVGSRSRSSVSVGRFSILRLSLLLSFLDIGSRAAGERAGASETSDMRSEEPRTIGKKDGERGERESGSRLESGNQERYTMPRRCCCPRGREMRDGEILPTRTAWRRGRARRRRGPSGAVTDRPTGWEWNRKKGDL